MPSKSRSHRRADLVCFPNPFVRVRQTSRDAEIIATLKDGALPYFRVLVKVVPVSASAFPTSYDVERPTRRVSPPP